MLIRKRRFDVTVTVTVLLSVYCRQQAYMQKMLDAKKKFLPVLKNSYGGTLLVLLDRSIDPAGPLVHDMTYEALCHDLLPTQHGKKINTMDPTDEIWEHLREKHFACAGRHSDDPVGLEAQMKQRLKQFKAEFGFMAPQASPAAAEETTAVDRRRDKKRVAKLKEYQKKSQQFQWHLETVAALQSKIKDRQLIVSGVPSAANESDRKCLCEVESNLITGRDQFDDKIKERALVDACRAQLEHLSNDEDKERLLALYWFCHGRHEGGEGEMGTLVDAAFRDGRSDRMQRIREQLVEHRKFCSNLDVQSEKKGTGRKQQVCYGYGVHRRRHTTEAAGQERNPLHERPQETSFEDQVSRYRPTLYWIVKDFVYRGSSNPYKKHWKTIGRDGLAQSNYTLQCVHAFFAC